MTPLQPPTKIQLSSTADYREGYANSVQVRVSLWDFFLMFGTVNQTAPDAVSIQNFQGVFVSPQQAKALLNVLAQKRHAIRGDLRRDQTGAAGAAGQVHPVAARAPATIFFAPVFYCVSGAAGGDSPALFKAPLFLG